MRPDNRKQRHRLCAAPYLLAWCAILVGANAVRPVAPSGDAVLTEVRLTQERRTSLAISPDGRLLVSGDSRGSIRAWDVKTAKLLWQTPAVRKAVVRLAFLDDGRTLASRHD